MRKKMKKDNKKTKRRFFRTDSRLQQVYGI